MSGKKKPQLTPWQSDLLDGVAAGISYQEISERYRRDGKVVPPQMVEQDVGQLRQQMGAKNNKHMIDIAYEWGWLE